MAEQQPGRAAMRGWVRALFVASLTLNLAVAGVVIGGLVAHEQHPPRPPVGDIGLGPFTEAFSSEDRGALRRAAKAEGLNFKAMRDEAQADLAALTRALEAEPWDEAAVQAALGAHRERTLERIEIGERLMVDRLRAMSPQERRAFAKRLGTVFARFERKPPEK